MSGCASQTIDLPFPPASLSGHAKGRRRFTADETERLRREYGAAALDGRLDALAAEMGRTRSSLTSKAYELGITDAQAARGMAAAASAAKSRGVAKWADRPHPRGFAGKTHTQEARERCTAATVAWWQSLSAEEKEARVVENLKAAIAKNGRIGPASADRGATWKAGWREIGGKRNYYRSRWEANYARYLEWLKVRGEIVDWVHEPETFWFEAIKRGVRSYLPDFRVFENDGSSKLHEVKGWMDSRSKTTLRRMAKYHPAETIIVVRERDYNSIARQLGRVIGGWEHSNRSDRP